jgi:protein TonB
MNRHFAVLLLLLVTACATQPSRPPEVLAAGGVVYPPTALAQHIEGYAVVGYDVTVDGTVTNAEVIESMPQGVFDEAALKAVRGWRFKPAVRNGEPVQFHWTSPVRFKLGESEDYVR